MQAKGLQSEYMRATSGAAAEPARGGAGGGGGSSTTSASPADVARLQREVDEARAEAKAAASSLAALKAQAGGLEREYDRLLSEHDSLKRQVARSGGDKKHD